MIQTVGSKLFARFMQIISTAKLTMHKTTIAHFSFCFQLK
jgi:hypothetical protein